MQKRAPDGAMTPILARKKCEKNMLASQNWPLRLQATLVDEIELEKENSAMDVKMKKLQVRIANALCAQVPFTCIL